MAMKRFESDATGRRDAERWTVGALPINAEREAERILAETEPRDLGRDGVALVDAATLIARTAERDALDRDHATWHKEWRIRALDSREQAQAAQRYGFDRSYLYALESRRVDTPPRPDAEWSDWRVCDYGATPLKACQAFPDDAFRRAESLDETHRVYVAWVRRVGALRDACTILARWDGRADAINAAERAYYDALKRARLYKAAQVGTAPPARINALRAEVKAAHGGHIARMTNAEPMVRAKVAALNARLDAEAASV